MNEFCHYIVGSTTTRTWREKPNNETHLARVVLYVYFSGD